MEVRFVQRGTEIDSKLRDYMDSKMSKLEKFFDKLQNCQIVVSHHKGNFNIETTANANGVILRAEENATEPRRAFDLSLKNLERRIKRYNSYLKDKGQFKGGADFSIRGRSDAEVMRFCQAFMQELYRHIGPDEDVPAGDIGVGGREIGYLFGEYKKLTHQFQGVLTGKGMEWGGSILRPEATGYGALYFVNQMLQTRDIDIKGKTVVISGFGNVAWGAAKKATQLGAKVITISGPDGYIYDPDGICGEKIDFMLELRGSGEDICQPYAEQFAGAQFFEGRKPWEQKADIYLTCATQNELNGQDADRIIAHAPCCVAEVSNMGCTAEAVEKFVRAETLFAPGKAVNAGGVATSGLEMTQNSMRLHWSADEVDDKLHYIMHSIHGQCVKYGTQADGYIDYVKGANVAGFMKVANAMMAQGIV